MPEIGSLTLVAAVLCLLHSGAFSGLNLALFRHSILQLETEAAAGNRAAGVVRELRRDSNRLLSTILWGNVAVNCLLTILLDSALAGVTAFLVSTLGITLFGEIAPQAYFSRNAIRVGAFFSPFIRVYLVLLYPLTKPTSWLLDAWLGPEIERWLAERDLRVLIRRHMDSPEAEVGRVEGAGALNFLTLDDRPIAVEAEILDPASVVALTDAGLPDYEPSADDPFLRKVNASGHKWVVLTDAAAEPLYVLDADGFLRTALFEQRGGALVAFCHRPLVLRDPTLRLEAVLEALRMRAVADTADDDVIDKDVVLIWGEDKRIITGADLLGSLLRGAGAGETLPGGSG